MFGISFVEFLVIAVVAIIFIGPEKLPELAQKLGTYMRQFRVLRDDFTRKMHDPSGWDDKSTAQKQSQKTKTTE